MNLSKDQHIRGMVIVFVLVWAIVISSPAVSVAQTTDLYPLAIGNKWTYSVTGNGPPREMKADVWSKQKAGTTDCLVLRYTILGSVTAHYYFAWQQENRLRILRSILDHDTVDYSPSPLLYLVTPLTVGQTWSWDGRLVSQQYGSGHGRFSARVIEKASIAVPAGTFETYHIGIDGGIGGVVFTAHRWFAQGVGLVREDYTDATVTYKSELESYFVAGFPLQVTFDVGGVGAEDWSASRSVTIDGTTYSGIDLPKSLRFDYKSTHTISVTPTIPATTEGIQYVFVGWNDGNADPFRTIVAQEGCPVLAKYKTQYLLTVESEHGKPQRGGWYDSGASAIVYVNSTVPMQGIMGILGARYVFAYWHDSNKPDFQPSGLRLTFVVDGPHTLRAVWREDYQLVYILVATILVLVSVIIVLVAMKKSSRARRWFSRPLRSEEKRVAAPIPAPLVREPSVESGAPEIKPVGELDVWTPIFYLGLMIFLGWVFGWILGVVLLVAAALYVHYDAKKYGIESHAWLTLLLAIAGLPLHANELHKLRKAQQAKKTWAGTRAPAATEGLSGMEKPTKFCPRCGAKIPRDSRYCEECGSELTKTVTAETHGESMPATDLAPPKNGVKPATIGLFIVLLIAIWAVSPLFVGNIAPALALTSTGSGGAYTLKLQNLTPWPMVVRGYWRFSPPITWSGGGPASSFTLIPFGAYAFEYMTYCAGVYCPGGGAAPYVTFTGDVTLLYRTYQVEIRSINSGR